jgi:hypothetical protein
VTAGCLIAQTTDVVNFPYTAMETRHLLILGAPRSGTTLLATMVGRHSEIGILNEDKGWSMRRIVGKTILGNKRCVPNQIEIKKRNIFHLRFFKTVGLAKEYQSSRYCIEDYLSLPNIRVVGLIRDANDVVSSIMKRSEKPFRIASYRWCRAVEIIHELKIRYPKIVLVVSFEDLVLNPKANMERVAAFLGLEYQDCMLEGPQYNPWYPEIAMNEAKANRSRKEQVDFDMQKKFPEIHQKYKELLCLSSQGAGDRYDR